LCWCRPLVIGGDVLYRHSRNPGPRFRCTSRSGSWKRRTGAGRGNTRNKRTDQKKQDSKDLQTVLGHSPIQFSPQHNSLLKKNGKLII
jgi:hypothetical protein